MSSPFTLPVNRVSVATYPPGAVFGPRNCRDYEWVYIAEGNVQWGLNDQWHDTPAGTMVLTRPGMRDGFKWDPKKQTRHSFIHFSLDHRALDLPADLTEPDAWPTHMLLPKGDIIRPLFDHLAHLLDQDLSTDHPLIQTCLTQMLISFITGKVHTRDLGPQAMPPAIERMFQHLHDNWQEGPMRLPTLAELAQAAHTSEVHLCRLCKQFFDHGPMTIVRMVRLDRASSLLSHTTMQIQEIAHATGFESAFHFSRTFRREFDCSPRDYRNRLTQGQPVKQIRLSRLSAFGQGLQRVT